MSWQYSDYAKFKIGDLVRIIERVEFILGNIIIEPGELGLIVNAEEEGEIELITYWGIDYIVLIKGHRLLFFESELELVEKKPIETKDNIKFIFLKN